MGNKGSGFFIATWKRSISPYIVYILYLNTNLYDYIGIRMCDYQIIMTFTPACAVVGCVQYRMWSIVCCRLITQQLFSRTRLTTAFPVSPSPPVLRPPVSHRGVHRPLFHSLQAVCNPAQPGLAPQSRRYCHCIPAQLYFPVTICFLVVAAKREE